MLTRGDVGLFFGLAGFLLGGAAYYQHFKAVSRLDFFDEVAVHDEEMQGQFAERITALEKKTGTGEAAGTELAAANLRISSLKKELTDGMNEVAALKTQIEGLTQRIQALEKPR